MDAAVGDSDKLGELMFYVWRLEAFWVPPRKEIR